MQDLQAAAMNQTLGLILEALERIAKALEKIAEKK